MQATSVVNGVCFKVPLEFEGILPVSPNTDDFAFEPLAYWGLRMTLEPGCVALDVGASFGVMTTLMALLAGDQGLIHAFEPNPLALAKAKLLAEDNQLAGRTQFHCACVGESSTTGVSFYVVPGFRSVASTRNPQIVKFHADAANISLPMIALDDLNLRPQCIKIDIEGGEHQAIRGARKTLEACHPDLVVETHTLEVPGIGGSVGGLCEDLEKLGYALFDLESGEVLTAGAYAEKYGLRIGYLLASVRLHDSSFVSRLVREHALFRSTLGSTA